MSTAFYIAAIFLPFPVALVISFFVLQRSARKRTERFDAICRRVDMISRATKGGRE